jgi:hypothetical protein
MFNYGEYIFQQLVTTEFVQNKSVNILISLTVNLINIHLITGLSILFSIHPWFDFIFQIAISVILTINVHWLYDLLGRYHQEFTWLAKYLINNYSIENYCYWKRLVIFVAASYGCVILSLIQITNQLLLVYLIQYLIGFLIIEQIEQQRIQKWLKDYTQRPVARRHDQSATFLINSYISPTSNLLRKPVRKVQFKEPVEIKISPELSGSICKTPENLVCSVVQ